MDKFESDSKEEAYLDRNLAVQVLAKMAEKLHYKVTVQFDKEDHNYVILYIDLPTGQVSWHIPSLEYIHYYRNMPLEKETRDLLDKSIWDGHTLEQKRERLKAFIREKTYD